MELQIPLKRSPADYMKHAVRASLLAGKEVMHYYNLPASQVEAIAKENQNSVVTIADKKSEEVIRAYLFKACPEAGFEGEEGGQSGRQDLRWIIDPIDGTANFASKYSDFGISIALADGDELVAAAIYLPAKDELFFAAKDNGAYLADRSTFAKPGVVKRLKSLVLPSRWPACGMLFEHHNPSEVFSKARRIHVAPQEPDFAKMMVSTGFSHSHEKREQAVAEFYSKYVTRFRDIVQPSSAVIGLTCVARGTHHAYPHEHLQIWDVAAGALLVMEAGGKIFNWDGSDWKLSTGPIVATNGQFPFEKRLSP